MILIKLAVWGLSAILGAWASYTMERVFPSTPIIVHLSLGCIAGKAACDISNWMTQLLADEDEEINLAVESEDASVSNPGD